MSGRGTGRLSFDPEAAARVRRLLSGRDDVVERAMVGGLSFLVNGNMCCGVTGTAWHSGRRVAHVGSWPVSGSAVRIIEAPRRLFSRDREGRMAAVPEDVTGSGRSGGTGGRGGFS